MLGSAVGGVGLKSTHGPMGHAMPMAARRMGLGLGQAKGKGHVGRVRGVALMSQNGAVGDAKTEERGRAAQERQPHTTL